MSSAPSPVNSLADLRNEIDALDAEIHRLLIQRSTIIDRLITVKGTAVSGSAFRPAREASMMRAIAQRHTGRLPLSTVEHIWRTIISTFTHVQSPYAVHVEGGDNALAMHDAVRYQVGFDLPLKHHKTAEEVIAAVQQSRGDLGFLSLRNQSATRWWSHLGHAYQPEIMARLPFVLHLDTPVDIPAVVIANPLGDAAVQDNTVVELESTTPDMPVCSPALELLSQYQENGIYYTLAALHGADIPPGARRIGSYATPLDARYS